MPFIQSSDAPGQQKPGGGQGADHRFQARLGPDIVLKQRNDFAYLYPVADRVAERDIHVRQHGDGFAAMRRADFNHQRGQRPRFFQSLHKRPAADLHVQHNERAAAGDLLAHNAGGDQRQRLDRAGGIAQRIQQAVGGDKPAGLGADARADCTDLSEDFVGRQRRARAAERFQLI